jgi:hypothetical protein
MTPIWIALMILMTRIRCLGYYIHTSMPSVFILMFHFNHNIQLYRLLYNLVKPTKLQVNRWKRNIRDSFLDVLDHLDDSTTLLASSCSDRSGVRRGKSRECKA